ncbi:hypothetical protein [Psychroserpens damuponensis]|uniref:hypothetical protein n=1 Tax=Psychroserpens damuponensis TaxID=943936 RepID=UPI00058ED38B|nr:hypothetical protein [Psychroserpens damuponensis]
MKNFILIYFTSILILTAQENKLITENVYYFNTSLNLDETNKLFDNSFTNSTNAEVKKYHQITIKSINDDIVEYTYLTFNNSEYSKIYNGIIYKLPLADFEKYTNPYYGRWRKFQVGAYTIPFRIRSKNKNFEFDSNLSLGANIIKGVNISRFYEKGHIDFSAGIALTKIDLNEDNSSIKDIDDELKTLSESALTFSLGITINFNEYANFGIFYGWDFLDGNSQESVKWIHNKKPWVGLGINVSFNNNSNSTTQQSNQAKPVDKTK